MVRDKALDVEIGPTLAWRTLEEQDRKEKQGARLKDRFLALA
jgi:hypothetical protein